LERRFESVSFKAVEIAVLTLLMLWPLMRVENEARKLCGSLLLFAILAALMLATRRLDWAKVGLKPAQVDEKEF
jgi:inner membrane protein involved in colicin E2 resistance